jgi:Zn-dependent hydrolases, including glyoxylases
MKYSFMLLSAFALVMFTNKINAQEANNTFKFVTDNFEITTLSEVQQNGNSSILIDVNPEILKKYAPEGTFKNAVNAFLLKINNKNILVDAGFGRNLFDNLKSENVTAEQVDIILLTHMHGDHIGGLIKDGIIAFPNAELYVAQAEYDYWMNNANGEQARNILNIYKDKLRLFVPTEFEDSKTELLPNIQAIAAFGHTPGHTIFLLKSSNSQFLIWGDLTHAMAIQMPHPEIAVTYDVNPEQAVVSRKKVLDYVVKNKITVAGMHIAYPSIGNVNEDGNGYVFLSAEN